MNVEIILSELTLIPFSQCYKLSREFRGMPTTAGLYAVRHEDEGVLYIGLAVNLKRRFKDTGHKAFFWAYLDYYPPDKIRIAVRSLIGFDSFKAAENAETLMIRSARPRYNTRIK
jgi:excinuclease UvrABC nuclease subunit